MSQDALPESALRFIAKYVVSVEQLEILLLISEPPEKLWQMEEVFLRIQSSRGSVQERLALLERQGFLASTGNPPAFRYRPTSPELAAGVEALRPLYRGRRVKVVEAIYAVPDSVRRFAEAFKLRKDE